MTDDSGNTGERAAVGFVGIGNMGWPMAARLVKAGFPVQAADGRRAQVDAFVQQVGGAAADSLPVLAGASDLIVTTLPTSAAVGAVLLTGYLGGAFCAQLRIEAPLFSTLLFPIYTGVLVWLGLYLRDQRVRDLVAGRR